MGRKRIITWVAMMMAAVAAARGELGAEGPPKDGPVTTEAQAAAGLNLDTPGLEGVKAALNANDLAGAKAAYLVYRRTASPARWRVKPGDQPEKAVENADAIGDEICQHIIRDQYYNFRKYRCDMGTDFNWLANPVARNSPDFSDEWTWCVISRTGFWQDLANAYWKTRDEKYAKEWVAELFDFAAKNRADAAPRQGVPSLWRTLDAAGRANDTWPYAYVHFLNSDAFTPEAQWVYLQLMIDHAHLLKQGLQDERRTGNWVVAECSALYTIGVLFSELKEAKDWRELALNRLTSELERMVPPDGFEAELTPMYHYFSLSSYATPYRLAKLNNQPIPAAFRAKMLAMYRAPVLMMEPSGRYVPTNDSGHYSVEGESRKGVALLGKDPILLWAASNGKEGTAPPTSTVLPYAGFYAMRSGWGRDDVFLFFRGGPAGIGHQHEDMLEIVLDAGGRTLLMDPGTYNYDHSDWRRFAINTSSHNTIIVDGKWQHRGPSSIKDIEPVRNPWVTTPMFDYVAATYDGGYQKNEYDGSRQYTPERWVGEADRSVTHTRRVIYLKPAYALVVDSLDGTGEHTFDAHFHLDAPAATLETGEAAAFSQYKDGVQLALYALDRKNLETEIIQGQKDPLLGWYPAEHRPIPTVRFRKKQVAPATFATLLAPFTGAAPAVKAAPLALSDPLLWGQQIQTKSETMQVILAKDQKAKTFSFRSFHSTDVKATASGLVLRETISGESRAIGGWDLIAYGDPHLDFTCKSPTSLLVLQEKNGALVCQNTGAHEVVVRLIRPWAQTLTLPAGTWMKVDQTGTSPLQVTPSFFWNTASPLTAVEAK